MYRTWLIAALCSFSCTLQAHDSWLSWLPEQNPQRLTELRLSTGDEFPQPGSGHSADSLELAERIKGELRLPLLIGQPTPRWLPLSAARGDAPALLARVSTRAQLIELDSTQIAAYLRELGDEPSIRRRSQQQPRWREQFSKHAKILVRYAAGAALAEASLAHGAPFELVPSQDPTSLPPGSPLEVCAFASGRAQTRAYIGLVEADGEASWQWSDPRGCVELAPRSDSGYLIRSVLLQPAQRPDLEWESHFASLTVYRSIPSSAP